MIFSHYQHQRNTIALSVFPFIAIALLNGIYVEALAKSWPFWFGSRTVFIF